MLRGITLMYCSECGKRFMGADIEWNATALNSPSKCPRCGSWHTQPWSLLPAKTANQSYKRIWKIIDQNHQRQVTVISESAKRI